MTTEFTKGERVGITRAPDRGIGTVVWVGPKSAMVTFADGKELPYALDRLVKNFRLAPDPDDPDRVLADLAVQHGDMHVSRPDMHGTVTITCENGRRFRYSAEGRVSVEPRQVNGGYHELVANGGE